MTGFKSKRDMAEDKLLPQKDFGDALTIAYQSGYYDGKKAAAARDKLVQEAFDEWWGDSNRKTLSPSNPCMTDSFEYWAWEGWHAALALTSTKCEVQPAQEPVAWYHNDFGVVELSRIPRAGWKPLTTPPQRTWVGLTEEEFSAINQSCFTKLQAATSAESILRNKNT